MIRLLQLLAILVLFGIAGAVDRASASEWAHLTPDRCTIIVTIENPIECSDGSDDQSAIHDESSDDSYGHDAIERGRDREQDGEDYVKRLLQRQRQQKCEQDRLLYEVRHPFVKPLTLRGMQGCDLYAADAAYHAETLSQPGVRGLLFGLVA